MRLLSHKAPHSPLVIRLGLVRVRELPGRMSLSKHSSNAQLMLVTTGAFSTAAVLLLFIWRSNSRSAYGLRPLRARYSRPALGNLTFAIASRTNVRSTPYSGQIRYWPHRLLSQKLPFVNFLSCCMTNEVPSKTCLYRVLARI